VEALEVAQHGVAFLAAELASWAVTVGVLTTIAAAVVVDVPTPTTAATATTSTTFEATAATTCG